VVCWDLGIGFLGIGLVLSAAGLRGLAGLAGLVSGLLGYFGSLYGGMLFGGELSLNLLGIPLGHDRCEGSRNADGPQIEQELFSLFFAEFGVALEKSDNSLDLRSQFQTSPSWGVRKVGNQLGR